MLCLRWFLHHEAFRLAGRGAARTLEASLLSRWVRTTLPSYRIWNHGWGICSIRWAVSSQHKTYKSIDEMQAVHTYQWLGLSMEGFSLRLRDSNSTFIWVACGHYVILPPSGNTCQWVYFWSFPFICDVSQMTTRSKPRVTEERQLAR